MTASRELVFAWSDEFILDRGPRDERHRHMVALIAELGLDLVAGTAARRLPGIIQHLLVFAQAQFAEELKLMRVHMYPYTVAHTEEHKEFVKTVERYQRQYELGERGVGWGLLGYLKRWMKSHVLTSDRLLQEFLDSKSMAVLTRAVGA